jgi:energy-coupling factor transporter ATP-binding protein EcfA2
LGRCQIPDRLGGIASLDRSSEVDELVAVLRERRCVALIGPSGSGKSVLGKAVAKALGKDGSMLCFDSQTLDETTITGVGTKIGIHHSLPQLVKHVASPSALLVLDGIDRFSPDAIRNTVRIVKALRLDNAESPWMLFVTCQTEEWERVALAFHQQGVSSALFFTKQLTPLSDDRLTGLLAQLPSLSALSPRSELRPLFGNLKILDIVASNSVIAGDVSAAPRVGESDLIRWFWKHVVANGPDGPARSRLLQKLGEYEAEHLRSTIAITDLDDSGAKTLGGLVDSRICRIRDEQVSFAHDLFGDWSRQRRLLGQGGHLKEFLSGKIAKPRWLRAIRLFGLDLLEQGGGDLTAWHETMGEVREGAGKPDLAGDLLLESVIFAANPLPILEAMWIELAANQGELLRRLLCRFLHVATMPNPKVLALTEDGAEASTFSASVYRLPYWQYWLPMLRFLADRAEDAAELVPTEAALIANTWLRMGPEWWPLRQQAASLAMSVAKKYIDDIEDEGHRRPNEEAKAVYTALLAASYVRPDEVAPIILALSKRTTPHKKIGEDYSGILDDECEELAGPPILVRRPYDDLPWIFHDDCEEPAGPPGQQTPRSLPPPWPDGPRERVDQAFQEVCLEPECLVPLIQTRPAVAREVLLALLIEHPVPERYVHRDMTGDRLGTAYLNAWYPPMFFRGPFRYFLSLQPEHGLDAIIRLVNFASERWAEQFERPGHAAPKVTIRLEDREQDLIGDSEVYFWYRDRLARSHSVPSALMALERWLYEKLANDKSIDKWIKLILDKSKTVALAAVLVAVGRKHPALFEGPLKPLLAVWQFYDWELLYTASREDQALSGIALAPWSHYGEIIFNAVREWHALPHRKKGMPEVALGLLFTSAGLRPFFHEIRGRWEAELVALRVQSPDRDFASLENLIAQFNPENWRIREHPQGALPEFVLPDEMREKREPRLKRNQLRMRVMTFPFQCRQIIDKREKLPIEQIEEIWNELIQIAGGFEGEDETPGSFWLPDVLCGGIAVLKCLHSDWLEVHPDRREWCDNWLDRIIAQPPVLEPMVFERTLSNLHWDSFLANIAASQWAERPEDPVVRALVAWVAMSFRYETVGILMDSAARQRDRLGVDFERLQSLIVLWAGVRNIWNYSRRFGTAWAGVDRWIARLAQAFVERRLPPRISSWARVAKAANHKVALMNFRQTVGMESGERPPLSDHIKWMSPKPGLDLELLLRAFHWIPSMSEARSPEERSGWIHQLRESLRVTLRYAASKEDERDSNHSPNDFDSWVFDRIAHLIIQLGPEDAPESFWKPILDLGAESHDWVENFLTSWFTDGLTSAISVANFTTTWRAMIEHALASPHWQKLSDGTAFDVSKMWMELLGLGWGTRMIKGEEHRTTVTSIIPFFREWASRWLGYYETARSLAHFLRQPSAADMLPEGVNWIFGLAQQYSDEYWNDNPRDADAFVSLVEHWWKVRRGRSVPTDETAVAMGLLKLLSDRQHPRALELQDRMARST